MEEKTNLRTYKGKEVIIDGQLTGRVCGSLSHVKYGRDEKILKWCYPNSQALYQNLYTNIRSTPPEGPFLWPQDILVNKEDDTIGYIMDIVPEGYHPMTDFLYQKEGAAFSSYGTALDAGIQIAAAFVQLHRKKYSFQSLDTDNILIRPQDGRVLFIGNEFAVLNDKDASKVEDNRWALPEPRYMAPEILRYSRKLANIYSDRYTLAVLLFLLIFLKHPMEGKSSFVPLLTPQQEADLYFYKPSFFMDRENKENGPDSVIHKNAVLLWQQLPEKMQKLFLTAFDRRALTCSSYRPKEAEWLESLIQLRSGVARCSCGKEVFILDGRSADCSGCNKKLIAPFTLQLRAYSVPGFAGRKILRCQLDQCDWDTCSIDRALETIGHIVANKSDNRMLGLKNTTDQNKGDIWRVHVMQDKAETEERYVMVGGGLYRETGFRKTSEETYIQPKAVLTLKDGLAIKAGRMNLGKSVNEESEIVVRKNV